MSFKTLAASTNTRAIQRNTPISQAIPGREAEMVQHGGGFVFKLDDWAKLDRFLIIGTEDTTFNLTKQIQVNQNQATVVKGLLQQNGNKVVDRCVEISKAGRAKNNDYALLVMALAMTHGNDQTKRYAAASLPLVARTGTHLMHFVQFANGMRGWGKLLKKAVANWYQSKTPDAVAYQAVKYQSRDGWSQRDILRLAHPNAGDDALRNNTYKWIVKGRDGMSKGDEVPAILVAFERAKTADKKTLINLITDHRLSHEMIPNEMKNDADVWNALSQHMGTTALVRNLNKLTSVGLIKPFSDFSKKVAEQLTNTETLKKDRIHPLQMLIAQRTYAQGRGTKGSLIWTPDKTIVQALEAGFYQSFGAIEPSGKNLFLALDVSASMNSGCFGVENLSCREAATVMAMVTARVEKNSQIFGFDHRFRDLGITANDTLQDACRKTYSQNFGSTNCSLPAQVALENKWNIDAFAIYTDNETNQGRNHPSQALTNYRNGMNKPNAKLISVGMRVNDISIADPRDAGMLDIAGFDANAPQFISAFVAGQM